MSFKTPPQIARLLLLTAGIVVAYFSARYVLKPATFGEFGWYRGAALEELRNRPVVFAGKKACDECHSELLNKMAKFEHKTVSCETCHGVSQAHADNPDVQIVKFTAVQCLRCHEAEPARPKWMHQIHSKNHYKGQRCTECHMPHQPNEVP